MIFLPRVHRSIWILDEESTSQRAFVIYRISWTYDDIELCGLYSTSTKSSKSLKPLFDSERIITNHFVLQYSLQARIAQRLTNLDRFINNSWNEIISREKNQFLSDFCDHDMSSDTRNPTDNRIWVHASIFVNLEWLFSVFEWLHGFSGCWNSAIISRWWWTFNFSC